MGKILGITLALGLTALASCATLGKTYSYDRHKPLVGTELPQIVDQATACVDKSKTPYPEYRTRTQAMEQVADTLEAVQREEPVDNWISFGHSLTYTHITYSENRTRFCTTVKVYAAPVNCDDSEPHVVLK